MSSQRLVCPGCSCLCDGLTPGVDSKAPVEVTNCSVGSAWFAARREPIENSDDHVPEIRSLLEKADAPLITGIGNLTTEGQQAAVKVADRYYASIDSGWSNAGRGSMASFQRYGKVTATFGEIANRSDLVVLWFCDPMKTHPRFIERFVRNGNGPKKRLIVIDETRTETAEIADEFVSVKTKEAANFVQQLRMTIDAESKSDLSAQLVAAKYGSVFVGKPGGTDVEFDVATDQWFQLVRSLNDHTRFVMSSLRRDRNGIGANNVLTSLCGFPDAVRFTSNGPVHNGLEYSTQSIIRRRECDLLIACDVGTATNLEARLDAATIQWLNSIPVVALSDQPASTYSTANVHITIGTPGWTCDGDFVRSDDVPIPMSAVSGVNPHVAADLFSQLFQ